ncbi:MAG: choice-of-anchor B family protein [Crocinitomicaceae bacterium]|nr:choice-of-anchor B family protein [Crocinitomicaceae bacterium]
MKFYAVILILIVPIVSFGQLSYNIELLDNWSNDTLTHNSSEVRYNDCWGIVHNDQEYAVTGSTEGIHFFRITNNNKLEHVDFVEGRFNDMSVVHRDIKTYSHYVYAVCDEGESSLQIIDFSYLPDSVHLVAENDTNFARVHNLFIDENNDLLYAGTITPKVNGSLQTAHAMQVYSLSNPESPTLVYTGPTDIPEVHDMYVRDNIAYLNCGFDGLRVYDFSSPSNPIYKQNLNIYQDQGYNHQGWMSPDGSTFLFADETGGKRIKRCSVANDYTIQIENYFGTNYDNNTIPHNIMMTNEFAYVAYYNEGLRIYDLRPNVPQEIAFFDTYLEESIFNMQGAWGVYSELPSSRILVSDRHSGLFLFDFNEDVFLSSSDNELHVFPNPSLSNSDITIVIHKPTNFDKTNIQQFDLFLYDINGKKIFENTIYNQTYTSIHKRLKPGVYHIRVEYTNYSDDLIRLQKKIIIL